MEKLGNPVLNKVTPELIFEALEDLREDGRSGATANRYRATLSAMFNKLHDRYKTNFNPVTDVKKHAEDESPERFITPAELERLLDACDQSLWPQLRCLVMFALCSGARRGELMGLRWRQVNLDTGKAILPKGTTKSGKPRTLNMTPEVCAILRQWQGIGDTPVFFKRDNPSQPIGNFQVYWVRARGQAGLTDFRWHDLRHSTASWLAQNGASLLEISKKLGHSSIQMTERYTHLVEDYQQQERTNSVFSQPLAGAK